MGTTDPVAVPQHYGGVAMRSILEADWAANLDRWNIEWSYEPCTFELPSGAWYMPDFWLPALRTFIEVKGTGVPRMEKPEELATAVPDDVIVLIGFSPARRSLQPYMWDSYMLWRDPLGYDTRLAKCAACDGWQWLRAELSRDCRLCSAPHQGFLAKPGEMEFVSAKPALSWLLGL